MGGGGGHGQKLKGTMRGLVGLYIRYQASSSPTSHLPVSKVGHRGKTGATYSATPVIMHAWLTLNRWGRVKGEGGGPPKRLQIEKSMHISGCIEVCMASQLLATCHI